MAQPQRGTDQRRDLAQACLGQLWIEQTAMRLVLWADLELLAKRGWLRSCRHMPAAGQRLNLAAIALGLGI